MAAIRFLTKRSILSNNSIARCFSTCFTLLTSPPLLSPARGNDGMHWKVMMMDREEMIDIYVKTLARVVGSEEEARKKIYSTSTRHHYSFGALVSIDIADKFQRLHGVMVYPDTYLDMERKVYPGDPFVNGKSLAFDPLNHVSPYPEPEWSY